MDDAHGPARRDGTGCDCDISLLEAALAGLWYLGTWAATAGHVPERTEDSAHPSIVPFQNFATQDGWVMVGCAKEKFWRALCREVIDRPDLLKDPRYADFGARERHRGPLIAELKPIFATRSQDHWLERLRAAGVPHSPNNTVPEALEDPQVAAREGLVSYEHPAFGTVRQVASAMRVGRDDKPVRPAPPRGEHTAQVLADLCGYGPGKLEELRRTCMQLARLDHDFTVPAEAYYQLDQSVSAQNLLVLQSTFCGIERDANVAAVRDLIGLYLRLAPPLARRHGVDYPADLEDVVLRRVAQACGISPPIYSEIYRGPDSQS